MLSELLDEKFKAGTTLEWMTKLSGRVPIAPVLTLPQALDNPYLQKEDGIQSIHHPNRTNLRVLSNPIRINQARPAAAPGPAFGADTDALLTEIGLGLQEITALRAENII